jgi:hypothetical protein
MPSYAYNGQSSPFNMGPFAQAMAGNAPFTTGFYNDNPDLAWEDLIRRARPSNSATDMLRRMFGSVRDQWTNQQWNEQVNMQPMTSFTDYVKNYNFNKEFARSSPNIRRENPSYFNRPVRTISF